MPKISSSRLSSPITKLGTMRLSSVFKPGGKTLTFTVVSQDTIIAVSRNLQVRVHAPSILNLKTRG